MRTNYDAPQLSPRPLRFAERSNQDPIGEYFRVNDRRGNYVFSDSGNVNLDALKTTPFEGLLTSLMFAKKIKADQMPPETVVSVVSEIATQARIDANKIGGGEETSGRLSVSQDAISNLLANFRKQPDIPFPSQAIRIIKDLYVSNPTESPVGQWQLQFIEQSNVAKLIVLDERNGEIGNERLGIRGEVAGEILSELRLMPMDLATNARGSHLYPDNTEKRALAYTLACGKVATREIMYQFLEEADQMPAGFLQVFGNALGFETMRGYLNDFVKTHPQSRSKLESLSKRVGLDKGEEVIFGPSELYEKIHLENYGPYNELQQTDINFLIDQLQGRKKVVDLGCGEGRHLIPLLQMGIPVEGVDLSPEALARLKSKAPQAIVHLGSMHNLPYGDGEVDAIYSLGRSLTHLTDIQDVIAVFKELRRVTAGDGIVLFDLPDSGSWEMREYLEQRRRYLWDKLHIWHREGTIHDSPDGRHYIDRFVFDLGQVDSTAAIAGFEAEIVQKAPYTGASGKQAQNKYWKLTVNPRGAWGGTIPESEPLKYLLASGNKGFDIDRY